jgi:glycine/D-amino acid oxidase-like deaminating enzyme
MSFSTLHWHANRGGSVEVVPLVPSLYTKTARAPIATPALDGDRSVSVAIVGAGITGLSAALHLATLGIDVAVIDAHEPGWGASGRNGGQVNPGLKHEPDEIERDFGAEVGARLIALSGNAPTYVFDLINRFGIDCEAANCGTLRTAVSARRFAHLQRVAEQWQRRGAAVAVLDRKHLREKIGTDHYAGAIFDKRGGSLNPLGYSRGLAEAALRSGAEIFSTTPAVAIERHQRQWQLKTRRGILRCDHVIIATNGYTDDLWPSLEHTIVPVFSAIAATLPLPAELQMTILPDRPVVYEFSSFYAYYRLDSSGHFLLGAGSPLRDTADPGDFVHLRRHAARLFPALVDAPWRYFWNGRVAITADSYLHFHEPEPGIHIALGYNGRGVAMATVMGRILAERISGNNSTEFALPVTPLCPIAFHQFWKAGVRLRRASSRLLETFGW